MKQKKIPRNKNISIRVTNHEKNIYETKAANYGIGVSKWGHVILKENQNYFAKRDNINQTLEIMENAIESFEETLEKIKLRKEETFRFSNEQVGLHFLSYDIFQSKEKLKSIIGELKKLKG